MTYEHPLVQIIHYPLTEEERAELDYVKAMLEISIVANRLFEEQDPNTRPQSTSRYLCDEIAIQRGFEGYGGPRLQEAFNLIVRIDAYEKKQKALLEKKRWTKLLRAMKRAPGTRRVGRRQMVGTTWLDSRFEIDVWRGIYRCILRDRGWYDPALSFKELRAKYPLTDDEIEAAITLTRWIARSGKTGFGPLYPGHAEAVLRALIHRKAE